jgi:hypothetical protein
MLAILKAFAGHIWPVGRMLCMSALGRPTFDQIVRLIAWELINQIFSVLLFNE